METSTYIDVYVKKFKLQVSYSLFSEHVRYLQLGVLCYLDNTSEQTHGEEHGHTGQEIHVLVEG